MSEKLELFPVAIGTYTDTDIANLTVDDEISEIVEALAKFDVHCVEWDTTHGRGHQAVIDRINRWAKSALPQTILYWVGHGWSDGRDTALAHTDSPVAVDTEGITPRQIAKVIAARGTLIEDDDTESGPPWMIVVVDACQSAAFVRELDFEIGRRAPDLGVGYLLIGGLSGTGATNLGAFSKALRFFLDTVCAGHFEIPLNRIAEHFQKQRAEIKQKWLVDDVVLHRRHATLVNLDLDTRNQLEAALNALDDDELRHFLPKAYGGDMPFTETMLGEQAWYFQGRHAETRRIVDWLERAETGMLVVTGPAGSGKSALLGHLIVHANPTLRTALHRTNLVAALPDDEQPPDNVFDAVLHLTGATTEEVVNRLAVLTEHRTSIAFAYLDSGVDYAVRHLVDALELTGRQRVTILVDALDEAVEPLLVANRVLAVMARAGVRVVVGTRASTHESPDRPSSDTGLLDALRIEQFTTVPITADASTVASYVRQRLLAARTPLQDRSGTTLDVESLVVAVRERVPQFLFARLLVHELLADPAQRSTAAWTRLLAGEHRALFATAVTRLTTDQPKHLALLTALAYARGRGLPAADNLWTITAQAITASRTTTISTTDVEAVTAAAAAYILADREHGQTVYRLAHRTFTEHFTRDTEPTPEDRDRHLAITDALIAGTSEHIDQVLTDTRSLNPYITHYLPAHAAAAGKNGWKLLDPHTTLLLALDPAAIATNAWRTDVVRYPLPDTIGAITTLNTHLQPLHPRDRYLPIQIHLGHTTPPDAAHHLPSWAPPITVETTTHAPSSPHRILTGHTSPVTALVSVAMPDGRTLVASASSDGTVRLWDPATGPEPHLLTSDQETEVLTSAAMPDGRTLLASGGRDGTVRLWDPTTRQEEQVLTAHIDSVGALASVVVPDGRTLLASGGFDGAVRLWDPTTGQKLRVLTV
ncbi:NACHT and WD repeat domain-containing protein, partial [Nocardia sp. NPDC055321]